MAEFTKSQTAERKGIDNTPAGEHLDAAIAEWIRDNLDFDQLILEFYTPGIPDSGWVHVSYKADGDNRKSILTASRVDGKTQYSEGINA